MIKVEVRGIVVKLNEYPCSVEDRGALCSIHELIFIAFVPSELCNISNVHEKRTIPELSII